MRAFRLPSGRRLPPFDEPARAIHVGTRTLAEWQALAVARAGLELVDVEALREVREAPALVFYDDVFFTESLLRHFVAGGLAARTSGALARVDGGLWRALGPLSDARPAGEDGHAYDVFFLFEPPAAADRAGLAAAVPPRFVDVRERALPIRLPKVDGDRDAGTASVSLRIVAHVRHWLHVLRLAELSIGIELSERIRAHPGRFLLAKLKGGGRAAIARRLTYVDPTAEVHPTADLEAAIVGPRTIVRAHAHVHYSVLGADVEVGDHSVLMGSAIAERVHVMRASYFALVAAMPGGTISNHKAQLSLFGRDVFLTSAALLLDAKLEGGLRVEHEGALVELGGRYLGACLGHRVVVGGDVTILPGRAIPSGVTIVGRPESQVAKADVGPGSYVVEGGRLVPRM